MRYGKVLVRFWGLRRLLDCEEWRVPVERRVICACRLAIQGQVGVEAGAGIVVGVHIGKRIAGQVANERGDADRQANDGGAGEDHLHGPAATRGKGPASFGMR